MTRSVFPKHFVIRWWDKSVGAPTAAQQAVVVHCLTPAKWWSPASALCLHPCCRSLCVPCLVQPPAPSANGQWGPSLLHSTCCFLGCLSHLCLLPLTLLVAWLASCLERPPLPSSRIAYCPSYPMTSHRELGSSVSACCECAHSHGSHLKKRCESEGLKSVFSIRKFVVPCVSYDTIASWPTSVLTQGRKESFSSSGFLHFSMQPGEGVGCIGVL